MKQLRAVDTAMFCTDTRSNPMVATLVSIYDVSGAEDFSFPTVARHILARNTLVPALRRIPRFVPAGLDDPYWLEAGEIRLADHVRAISVPEPGDAEALDRTISEVIEQPLDPSRPLWENVIVYGSRDGRVAVLVRAHHGVMDGTAAVQMMATTLDAERVPEAEPEALELADPGTAELPDGTSSLRLALRGLRRLPPRFRVLGQRIREGREQRAEQAASGIDPRSAGVPRFGDTPKTPFNGPLTPSRRFRRLNLPLEEMLEVRRRVGVTFNDVAMCIVGSGLARVLEPESGVTGNPLVAIIAKTYRDSDQLPLDNRFDTMLVSLATEIPDPLERLRAVHERADAAKGMLGRMAQTPDEGKPSLAFPGLISGLARGYDRFRIADRHKPIANVYITNMRGPDVPLYFAGAELVEMMPIGPMMPGVGLGVAIMTYNGTAGIGIVGCGDLVEDIDAVHDAIAEAHRELYEAR